MKPVRTRFAPSPTGFLHVGNVRSALFPWLIAQQAGGSFVLRVEDTDQAREVAGAVEYMHETLTWLGIEWDEGPDKPGQFGPYTQSQRRDHYVSWAQKLIAADRAYADVRTPEELTALREEAKAAKRPFLARDYRPASTPEWKIGMPLRFKSDPKAYTWHDAVIGELSAGIDAVDDFIIIKSDGLPTYNFAHIVDDAEMQITHVIRGSEYIASVPKYLNLYEALELDVPILAHVPHIMAEDGKRKLSKRDGAVSILDYKQAGYLPEAMLNFLASMGWNDGTEQEIFSKHELIEKFSLERVQRSGAIFDQRRLDWMNGTFIRQLSLEALSTHCEQYWPESAFAASAEYKQAVLALVQERMKKFSELPLLTEFFFSDLPIDTTLISNNKQLKKLDGAEIKSLLEQAREMLQASDFSVADLTERLNKLLEKTSQKPGILFSLIRIATTQAAFSPALADTLSVLGQETALRRLDTQINSL